MKTIFFLLIIFKYFNEWNDKNLQKVYGRIIKNQNEQNLLNHVYVIAYLWCSHVGHAIMGTPVVRCINKIVVSRDFFYVSETTGFITPRMIYLCQHEGD